MHIFIMIIIKCFNCFIQIALLMQLIVVYYIQLVFEFYAVFSGAQCIEYIHKYVFELYTCSE